jgi:thiaminase/transcriptional activator TenA
MTMKTTMSKDVPNITQTTINRSWSGEVWKKSLGIYNAILGLDFLKELSQGTLGRDAFARYIAQDEIYLKNYYSQMYMLADLMENLQDRNLFLSFAQSGMEGEKALHEMLIGKYSINTEVKE